VLPMLGREVVEGEQCDAVLDQAFRGLVVLGAVFRDEAVEGLFGGFPVLGLVDGVQVLLRLSVLTEFVPFVPNENVSV
jgi:hypothetical protein